MKKPLALLTTTILAFSLNNLPVQAQGNDLLITLEPQSFQTETLKTETFLLKASPTIDHGTTIFGLPVNEGPIDRSIRAVIAAGLIGTGAYGLMNPTAIPQAVSYTLLGVSAVPVLTAATGYCPLYQLVGIDYTF